MEGLKGRGWKRGAVVLAKLPVSLFQSLAVIRRFSPDLVLGVGGYSAGPLCLAAKIMGIPTAIHEQNSYPGLTNRLLCRVVDRVFISFQESRSHFSGGTLLLTGNPVREELLLKKGGAGREDRGFTLLVMGGSQGARAINRAFVEALEVLRERGKEPTVIHQTGEGDYAEVLEAYRAGGLRGEVLPFIEDMAGAYGRADLVLSRAGATTVSELAVLGLPSILIPYPYAANRHQETNARMLVEAGGGEMVLEKDLSGEGLAGLLVGYMEDRKALLEMGRRAEAVGRADAAGVIADNLVEMMG